MAAFSLDEEFVDIAKVLGCTFEANFRRNILSPYGRTDILLL